MNMQLFLKNAQYSASEGVFDDLCNYSKPDCHEDYLIQ